MGFSVVGLGVGVVGSSVIGVGVGAEGSQSIEQPAISSKIQLCGRVR